MTDKLKAYRSEWMGIIGIVYATDAGKARYASHLRGRDAGYDVKILDIKIKRAPSFDDCLTCYNKRPQAGECWGIEYLKDPEQFGR